MYRKNNETTVNDGFVFDEDDELISYVGTAKEVTIPAKVERLPAKLFKNNCCIEKVTIPRTVTSIGTDCFKGCKSLTTVNFGADVNNVPTGCFNNCVSLREVNFQSKNLRKIGDYAFKNCCELESITLPQSIKSIGIQGFKGCDKLQTIENSQALSIINSMAFQDCEELQNIRLERINLIGACAFMNCNSLTTIEIPSTCKTIQVFAFSNCDNLESVTLETSFGFLEYGVFANCENLKSLKFKNVKSITGLGTFAKTDGLSEVTTTKTCLPLIGYSGLLRGHDSKSSDCVNFNFTCEVNRNDSYTLNLTGYDKINEKGKLNKLNNCVKYLKKPNADTFIKIKNRFLECEAQCCVRHLFTFETSSDVIYSYYQCIFNEDEEFFKELCENNQEFFTKSVVFDIYSRTEDNDLKEYLLTLINDIYDEENTTHFSDDDNDDLSDDDGDDLSDNNDDLSDNNNDLSDNNNNSTSTDDADDYDYDDDVYGNNILGNEQNEESVSNSFKEMFNKIKRQKDKMFNITTPDD